MRHDVALVEVRAGLWLTELALPDFSVRGAVIVGEKRTAVWDTLSHPVDMHSVQKLLQGRAPIVVYSHADWDHVWGTAGLPTTIEWIAGHDECRRRFSTDVPATLNAKQSEDPEVWDDVVLIAPDISFAGTMTIDLGGVTFELHHLPGHTADCIVGFLPEWGILLAGDTVETPLPVMYADSPLGAWLERLATWQADGRVTTVIPAHGVIGGREVIEHTLNYLERIQTGKPFVPAEPLDEFYRETHAANQRYFVRETANG